MANTFVLIANTTLTTATQTITFSAIPQTYYDLVVMLSERDQTGAANFDIRLELNGDTATNYSTQQMYGAGSGTFANYYSNATYGRVGYSNSSGSTASFFNNVEIYIPSYTSPQTQHKQIISRGATENRSTSTAVLLSTMATLWRNTAAITSLSLTNGTGNSLFDVGTSAYLYGIKNT